MIEIVVDEQLYSVHVLYDAKDRMLAVTALLDRKPVASVAAASLDDALRTLADVVAARGLYPIDD